METYFVDERSEIRDRQIAQRSLAYPAKGGTPDPLLDQVAKRFQGIIEERRQERRQVGPLSAGPGLYGQGPETLAIGERNQWLKQTFKQFAKKEKEINEWEDFKQRCRNYPDWEIIEE